MKNTKVVTVEFNSPISMEVEIGECENLTKSQLQKMVIEQLTKSFPSVSYSIDSADALTFENVKQGMIVKDEDKGTYGVVLKVNKKTINVSFQQGVVQGPPQCFSKAESNIKAKDIIWDMKREDSDYFIHVEGEVGFFVNNDEIIPIVLLGLKNDKHKALIIGKDSFFKGLSEQVLKEKFFHIEKDAKAYLKTIKK